MWYIIVVFIGLFVFFLMGHSRRRKNAKVKVISVIEKNCKGCRQCLKCPRDVFDLGQGYAVVKNPENCTACGKCIPVCKFDALELINRK